MIQPAVVRDVRVSDHLITMVLKDGREVSVPTAWSDRLSRATREDREHFVIDGDGMIVAWPDIDEHIGVWTMLGVPEEEVFAAAGLRVSASTRG